MLLRMPMLLRVPVSLGMLMLIGMSMLLGVIMLVGVAMLSRLGMLLRLGWFRLGWLCICISRRLPIFGRLLLRRFSIWLLVLACRLAGRLFGCCSCFKTRLLSQQYCTASKGNLSLLLGQSHRCCTSPACSSSRKALLSIPALSEQHSNNKAGASSTVQLILSGTDLFKPLSVTQLSRLLT